MNPGIRLLKLSALYLALGSLLGLYMGVTKDFVLSSVHAHVALLGWLALALAGLVYTAFPTCGASRLAKLHIWGHNIGLPVMVVSLSLHVYGMQTAEALVGISSSLVVGSLLALAASIGLNIHRTEKSG